MGAKVIGYNVNAVRDNVDDYYNSMLDINKYL
jgi:hypothetical protein